MRVQPDASPDHTPPPHDEALTQTLQHRSQEHLLVFRQSIQGAAGFQKEILECLTDWAEDLLNT